MSERAAFRVRRAVVAGASMSKVSKLAAVVFFFFLIGWLYIHTGRLPGGAHQLEAQLARVAQHDLDETGHGAWAHVEMHGRVAYVFGVAPNEAARMEALGAVKSAVCCDGVARVADRTDLLQVVEPYLFEARLDEAGLHLSGYAPDRDARAEIEERAIRLFETQTRADERRAGDVHAGAIEIASGAPPGANWIHAIEFGVSQLMRLDRGVLRIEGEDMTLFGVAPSPQVRAAVAQQLFQAPAPFRGRAEIERALSPAPAPVASEPSSDATSSQLSPGSSPGSLPDGTALDIDGEALPVPAPPEAPPPSVARDACQADFNDLLSDEAVQFSFSNAEISDASAPLLDAIAVVALRCSGYSLQVEGHSDSTGDPAFNVDLSQRRAQAVVDFLAQRGVDLSRLSAQGFGAAAPIATNNTIQGRRRNRRIEIEVIE